MSTKPVAKIKTFQFGNETVTLETGRIARQADGAVLATMGKTQVLATVVAAKSVKAGQDFFPLSVHYQEKMYAAGRVPGGYLKREGRPSEKETLTSRLIDRPIRPLFPEGFMNEVQVLLTVMGAEKDVDPDICAMIATSAALAVSGIPFNGPIGGARVGFTEEDGYLLNPTYSQLQDSLLDMVVAGTKDAVLMVESQAQELTEDEMLGAVLFAQGTRGASLINGAEAIKIHGEYHAVQAEIANLDALSSHGDYREICNWLKQMPGHPRKVFITHGEAGAADCMRQHLKQAFGWEAEVPEYLDTFEL